MNNSTNPIKVLSNTEKRGKLYLHSLTDLAFLTGRGKDFIDGFFWLDGDNTDYIMFRPSGKIAEKHFRRIPVDGDIRYISVK